MVAMACPGELPPTRLPVPSLSHPLHTPALYLDQMAAEIAATTSTLFTPKRTAKEYVNFLVGFKENVPALRKLNMGMREFKRSYVVVRGYLQDAVERVDNLCDTAANEMVKANPHYATCRFNKKHMAELSLAIRSYFLSGVYDKLMPDIEKMEEEEDTLLSDCLNQATNITATDLGIRVEFQCPLPEAVHSLSQLNNFTTPREKLLCLKDTTSLITSAVDQYLSHFKMKETIAFSTDDLLPLLIYVLIQAKPAHLKSSMYTLHTFFSLSLSLSLSLSVCICLITALPMYVHVPARSLGNE
eukprot:TRINITY_DN2512_c0_g1_i9.p1 TRINITY_DN2512_c0_g1~~TRINITY_DN2512_c0_g1_i9.p1  ORF type:complete len:300 (-),score=39.13 TRINITY_DN2512_c0_g1_i9:168-1067(-)